MLYRTLQRVIDNAKRRGEALDDISDKIDVLYAAGKLTTDEYQELQAMMAA